MTANVLDWSDCHSGRLGQEDVDRYAPRAEACATRLTEELAAGRLPFIDMPYWDSLKRDLTDMREFLAGFEHMVLLGIGGSALGARALQRAFAPQQDRPGHQGPWLWVADNIDVYGMEHWFSALPADKTVVVVISKSGGTIETIGQYFLVREWLQERLGDAWKDHLLYVTDADKGFLRQEAERTGARSLPVPDNLGGRYSALSAVGLVPAAFLGMDYEALVHGALDVGKPLTAKGLNADALGIHPSWRLACWARALMDKGYGQLIFFSYIPLWAPFGDWFSQLWAESLGKEGKGSQPVPAVGVTDQHSVQQMFLDGPRDKACLLLSCPALPKGPAFPRDLPDAWGYLQGLHFGDLLQAEGLGTQMALTKNAVPLVELRMGHDGPEQAGRLMGLLEIATLLTGWLLEIDPLDQPAVELGKRLANARLGAPGLEDEKADLEAFLRKSPTTQEF
jgi:glucose-6-phosphate isomerase